ncbi:unnamed protein product [Arctogadus glacialis]
MANCSFGEYGSRMAELEHSHSRLRKETGEMRHLLEVADEEVAELRMENAALTGKVEMLESSLSDAGHIQVELRRVKSLLCEEQSSNRKRTSNKEQEIQKLEEERKILTEQAKGLSAQLKELQQQREQRELSQSNLEAALQRLQIKMEDIRQELKLKDEDIHQQNWQLMQLEEMREEYTNIIRDLRLRNKDLESQVELQQEEAARLVNHQYPRNPLSIADEVELQAYLAVVENCRREEKDDGKNTAVKPFPKSQGRSGGQMLHGVLTKGLLALGGVSVLALGGLSVLAVTAPMLLDNWGYSADLVSTNDLWKTVHDLFLRNCDKQYKCLPPV